MKSLITLFLANLLFLLATIDVAHSADHLIGTSGANQLVDNAGKRWNAQVAYTTNGNSDVYTLGGLLASDHYFGDSLSGSHLLIDNAGRKWNLNVFYTTDGAGNVIPISAGGGGGGTWGSITGTLSSQTDLQNALNLKANTAALAPVATSGVYSDLTAKPTFTLPLLNTSNVVTVNNFGGDSGAGGLAGAVPAPATGKSFL